MFWDGRELGQTAVLRKTLAPVWVAHTTTDDQRKGKNREEHHTTSSPVEEGSSKPYFWLESARSVNPLLRVELYDWDAVGSHDFLGGVELDLDDLVELQRETLRKARARGGDTEHQVHVRAYATGFDGDGGQLGSSVVFGGVPIFFDRVA